MVSSPYQKRQRVWLRTVVILMFLTALVHATGFFVRPVPKNDTEQQLYELMQNYRLDLGGGLRRTTANLVTALSACFSLLCVLGGLTIAYLARRQVATDVTRGMLRLHLLVFAVCFALMAIFTFWPPIALSGLIVLSLIIAERSLGRP